VARGERPSYWPLAAGAGVLLFLAIILLPFLGPLPLAIPVMLLAFLGFLRWSPRALHLAGGHIQLYLLASAVLLLVVFVAALWLVPQR